MPKEKQEEIINIDAIVDAWFASNFHNSPASADTVVYNLIHAAKEDLKTRLKASLS